VSEHAAPSLLRRAIPLLTLVLLTVGFYWKLTLSTQYVWFDHPDMCYIEIPRLQMQTKEIHARRFPMWDPYLWVGQPLIGQTQPGPLYPLNLVFTLLPRKGGFIQFPLLNAYYVFIHLLAAWGAWRLLRDWGRSHGAALFGGCLFAFSGFVGTVPWLDVLNGAIWTPLTFLHVFRALRGERPWANAGLSGLWMGVAWLSGHHEVPLMVTLLLLGTWAWKALQDRKRLGLAAVSLGIMALVGAAQILPAYEFGGLSRRWIGLDQPVGWNETVPYEAATIYSMPARAFLGLALPGQANLADASLFVGVAGLCLAALGLRSGWRDERVRWAAVVAAVGLLFAMGAATPFHGILYSFVPVLSKARIPVRAISLLNFGVAVLAAYGVDGLLRNEVGAWARRVERVALALGALILASAAVIALALRAPWSDGVLLAGVIACVLAGLLAAYRSSIAGPSVLVAGLLGLAIVEWYGAAAPMFSSQYDRGRKHYIQVLTENRDIADYLHFESQEARKAGQAAVRVAVSEEDIPTNFGDWHAIEVLQGYVAGVPKNLIRAELHTRRSQELFAVTHWVGRKKLREDQEEVFTGASGIKVWRNPGVMPRAWIAHQAVRVNTDGELQSKIQNGEIDFARQVVTMQGLPALDQCAGDEVRFKQWSTDRVTLSAQVRCRGVLVLADAYYPGWQARVDGRASPVHEVYGAVRGVVVEAGEHEVEFLFRPASVYLGLLGSAVGLLVVLVLRRLNR
jgi:hypothetical protein